MTKQYFDAKTVRDAASGNWLEVLMALAPHLEGALRKPGRHAACPVHGGKDGFRLFKDVAQKGGGICNSCGPKSDGISLLMWVNGWDYPAALENVAHLLGVEPKARKDAKAVTRPDDVQGVDAAAKPVREFSGRLVGYGAAIYPHDENKRKSYFVQIEQSNQQDRTLWGVDLERALQNAKAEKGDFIIAKNMGREAVTVELPNGRHRATHRNTWVIESQEAQARQVEAETQRSAVIASSLDKASATQANVVSMHKNKPWLKELRAELEERAKRDAEYSSQLRERIQILWDSCIPLHAMNTKAARIYLNARCLSMRGVSSDSLRYTPALPYYDSDGNKVGDFPALVAAIRDVDGEIVTLHRTYLSEAGGKARIPGKGATKKMMSVPEGLDVKGCAIQLSGAVNGGVLGVAEGIETALSAQRATGMPTWAAVSAVLMEHFEVPEGVHTVVVWADKDVSTTGERSAEVLRSRLERQGIKVHVLLPPMAIPATSKSVDWNDVLVQHGITSFPEPRILRALSVKAS